MKITKRQLRRLIQEAMPRGGAPDIVGYLNKGRPDPIVDAMIDDYEDFVEREGHITRQASSVAASFFMQDPERRDDHEAHKQLADAIGLEHDDIMRDMERQKREQGVNESSLRKHLKMIIQEMTMAPGGGNAGTELAAAVQDLVDDGKGLFDFKKMLEAAGYQDVQVTSSPISMVMVRVAGEKFAIVSSNVADPGPNDHIVGKYVVGKME